MPRTILALVYIYTEFGLHSPGAKYGWHAIFGKLQYKFLQLSALRSTIAASVATAHTKPAAAAVAEAEAEAVTRLAIQNPTACCLTQRAVDASGQQQP